MQLNRVAEFVPFVLPSSPSSVVVQSTFSVIILQPINGTENLLNYTFGAVTKLPAKEHKMKMRMKKKMQSRKKKKLFLTAI